MAIHIQRLLIVHTPGTRLTLDNLAVRATNPDGQWKRLPLAAIGQIATIGDVSVDHHLMAKTAEHGIPITWLSITANT